MIEHGSVAERTRALPRVRVGAVVAVVLAAGFVAWLLLRHGAEPTATAPKATRTQAAPQIVSAARLHVVATRVGHPVYWVGARRGIRYELTEAAAGRTFIRYLPLGVAAGDRRAAFLAVATYPEVDALARIRAAGKRPGAVVVGLAGGGMAVYDRGHPTNVYFAFPRSAVQVEVYDPSGRTARQLVVRGQVVPIR